MLNRRMFCQCASLALFTGASVGNARAEPAECAVLTPDRQQHISPDEAIARLKAGNDRFVTGATVNCDLMTQVRETAKTQAPFAAIVGCIDSRVPPELVFDQRIGDVFCARIAGNFINDDIIGSLEFATQVSGARAIVVLGHSSCGAIKGAIDGVKLGHLTGVLAHIRPAVSASKAVGKPSSKNDAFVQAVAETNARMAVAALTKRSPILKALAEKGALRVAAAMHDLATGRVSWLS